MARDLRAFYAAQDRLRDAAEAEWTALGRRLGPFRLVGDVEAWAAGLAPDAFAWPGAGITRAGGQGVAGLARGDGRERAYGAGALCTVAMADGVLVPPVPGRLGSAFASRDPVSENETALGYGFEPDAAPTLLLHAATSVRFVDFETPRGTPDGVVAAHVLRLVVGTLHGWRSHIRKALLHEASLAARG